MPETSSEIEIYKHDLSEAESHLFRLKEQLNNDLDNNYKQNILNDITQVEIQIEYYNQQIEELS